MSRLHPSTRTRREEPTAAGTTPGGLDLRTAVLGVGALTAGYLVGRRLPSVVGASTGDLRERAGEALPGDGVDVPIGGTEEEGEGDDEGEERAGTETGTTGEDDAEVAGTDPSLEEVDERTGQADGADSAGADPVGAGTVRVEEDVDEEPAEPGEMQVDEDVVEEATDEDGVEDEDDEE